MEGMTIALVGYTLAALAFGLLTVLTVTSWRGGAPGALLAIACGASTAWAGLLGVWSGGTPLRTLTRRRWPYQVVNRPGPVLTPTRRDLPPRVRTTALPA